MRNYSILFILLFTCSLSAQKPTTAYPFERVERGADVPSEIRGNERISLRTNFPIAIYNPDFEVTPATPEVMAREYLNSNRSRFGLTAADLNNLQVHFIRESAAATTVRFRQYTQGIEVQDGEISISISPKHRVCFVTNDWQYGVELAQVTPQISPSTASNLAAAHIDLRGAANYEAHALVVANYETSYRLAHRITIEANEPLGGWDIFVDAQSGEILYTESVTCTYHNHAKPVKPKLPIHLQLLVDGTGNVFDTDPLATANANYNDPGYSDNNDNNSPQLLAEQQNVTLLDITQNGGNYFLIGPWAEIQDFESPFRGLFEQPTPNWNGNRTDNSFEAVNVYYHIDASMRYLNLDLNLGIQPSAYPGGVRFDPSGLNNADNSHYLGGSQRLSFGDGGVDDAEDSDVIHHELGHGLHDWVTGGGLSQVQGLSEGCGDYWAASYNRSLGLWSSNDAPYNWVFRWDGHNEFWNGRIVNHQGIYPGGLSGGIHNQGQLWATSMMLVWDAIGKEKTDRIFWQGLGMTGGSSSQDDAANAVYQAANNLNYSNDCRLQIHTILTDRGYNLPAFVLPVRWTNIEAMLTKTGAEILWTTANERNNAHFIVERSTDGGRSFTAISQQILPKGSAASYSFIDKQPQKGENIYRIRQTDVDGAFSFSPLANVINAYEPQWTIGPNPAQGTIIIGGLGTTEPSSMSIVDLNGREVLSPSPSFKNENSIRLDISELPTGVYLLRLKIAGQYETKRFVVK